MLDSAKFTPSRSVLRLYHGVSVHYFSNPQFGVGLNLRPKVATELPTIQGTGGVKQQSPDRIYPRRCRH